MCKCISQTLREGDLDNVGASVTLCFLYISGHDFIKYTDVTAHYLSLIRLINSWSVGHSCCACCCSSYLR